MWFQTCALLMQRAPLRRGGARAGGADAVGARGGREARGVDHRAATPGRVDGVVVDGGVRAAAVGGADE